MTLCKFGSFGNALLCHKSRSDEIKKNTATYRERQMVEETRLRAFQNRIPKHSWNQAGFPV